MFRCREKLQKMFLPADYQEVQAARPVQPGERRVHTGFDLKMKFDAQVAMDIMFSKDEVRSHQYTKPNIYPICQCIV